MNDVTCPYCGYGQEINHDDGYGYDEDVEHEQECRACEKTFIFFTRICFDYDVRCQPENHDYTDLSPIFFDMEQCSRCSHVRRKPTT